MFGLGIPELLIVLVIVVLLFGAGKLSGIMFNPVIFAGAA